MFWNSWNVYEAKGGDHAEGSKERVYDSVFPFENVPSSVAFFYLKPVNVNSEIEVALYNDREKLLQVKRYPLKLSCDDVWWRYTYSTSGGGDGSSVSKIENTTKIVTATDGSLIVWNTYMITRSELIFFRSEETIETWYRFQAIKKIKGKNQRGQTRLKRINGVRLD